MDPLVAQVVVRFASKQDASLWTDAVDDLTKFNALYTQVEKKPQDEARLRKAVNFASKMKNFGIWNMYALTKAEQKPLWDAERAIRQLAKDKAAGVDALWAGLESFKSAVQKALDATAPEQFTYQGFPVVNQQHLSDELCRKALSGFDYLKALFKKRGVEGVLDSGIARIILLWDAGSAAFFHAGTREMTLGVDELSKGGPGRFVDTAAGETVLHEFGHYVHRVYITGEARDAWEAPWGDLPSEAGVNPYSRNQDPKRNQKLEPLEIVTDYGKVDKYEDFAETFMVFMAAPDKLTPTAKYRMQQALSLSGLYGKPVLKLAHRVLARYLAGTPVC